MSNHLKNRIIFILTEVLILSTFLYPISIKVFFFRERMSFSSKQTKILKKAKKCGILLSNPEARAFEAFLQGRA